MRNAVSRQPTVCQTLRSTGRTALYGLRSRASEKAPSRPLVKTVESYPYFQPSHGLVVYPSPKLRDPLVEVLCLLWVAVRYPRLQPSHSLCPAIGRAHESVG
jgi:hypothetical protein